MPMLNPLVFNVATIRDPTVLVLVKPVPAHTSASLYEAVITPADNPNVILFELANVKADRLELPPEADTLILVR